MQMKSSPLMVDWLPTPPPLSSQSPKSCPLQRLPRQRLLSLQSPVVVVVEPEPEAQLQLEVEEEEVVIETLNNSPIIQIKMDLNLTRKAPGPLPTFPTTPALSTGRRAEMRPTVPTPSTATGSGSLPQDPHQPEKSASLV